MYEPERKNRFNLLRLRRWLNTTLIAAICLVSSIAHSAVIPVEEYPTDSTDNPYYISKNYRYIDIRELLNIDYGRSVGEWISGVESSEEATTKDLHS